ncbi:MAG: hypothetical protein K2Q34_03485 [Alphaproteobacteria bacterium]|nr:hypothetical protein [Alphaproteobacteria bacterium]
MMNQFLKILNVLLFVTLNLSVSTNVSAEDSDEEIVIRTGRRNSTYILSDDEERVDQRSLPVTAYARVEDSDEEIIIRTGKRNSTHISSDSEEDDEESIDPSDQPFRFHRKKETRDAVTNAVKSGLYHSRQEIADALGVKFRTVVICLSDLGRAGLLTQEELKSVNLVEQRKFHHEIVELIRQRKTVEEILKFCKQHEVNPSKEKTDNYLSRHYLTGMFKEFYDSGELTSNDTAYLKLKGSVVGRRGETSDKIAEFIKIRSSGLPTATRLELAQEFNDFAWEKYNIRAISIATFVEHVNKLIKKRMLNQEQSKFFDACKDEKQQDGYIPASKRAKRK